uniref:Winged helix-turn-helix transcriptional regulator n=1 Tax=Candidatus Methanomethylicus mesodigestus TaxID=1867258 RepID=A0A7C3J506_9CREN
MLWNEVTKLIEVLKDEKDLSLSQLVEKSGLGCQTVHSHLKHLLETGFVWQEAAKHGVCRPTMVYHRFKQRTEVAEANVVRLKFQKLKHASRFEKGGWCKELRGNRASEKYP